MKEHRAHGSDMTVGGGASVGVPVPGRHPLTGGLTGPSRDTNDHSLTLPHGSAAPGNNEDTAARLAATQSKEHSYPHRETIESLFGRPVTAHAYVDSKACDLIDAEAYRTGDRVVFDSPQPTLHTAAHEAAHAVSGADEHTADRAADAVVAGRSAAPFLGAMSSPAPVVQAKKKKAKKPDPSPIVYVGMNKGAKKESETLEAANRDRGGVNAIINNPDKQDTFTDGTGADHDLTDDTGTASLVEAWGISDAQEAAVEQLIKDTGSGTKDEVFQLAKAYAEADLGKRTMERMVLSGHSIGGEIFGEGAWMDFAMLVKLKTIFPTAAAGVKHVMLSACSSGYEATMAKFQEAFPNVKTIWGYAGVCPTGSGARSDMQDWEGKTDDKGEQTLKPPGHGVGTWSEKEGYKGGEAMTYADALADVQGKEAEFQDYLSGNKEVISSSSGPIYTYYRSLQRLLGKPELVDPDRATWTARMKVAVRLRFWPDIRGKFGVTYEARLKKGYAAIGRKMPDFSKITRANALAEMAAFEATSAADAADTLGLLRGLRDLDEKTIDGGWL